MLFCSMGGCVPEYVFERSLSSQWRWSDDGTKQLVTPAQATLDPQLAAFVSNPERFKQALDRVRNLGFVSESSLPLSSELYTKLSQFLTKQVKEKWSIRALRWLCFIFPRHELWEESPSFTSIVRSLQPLMERLVRSVEEANIPQSLKDEVSEALLAASKVGNIRSNALSLVADLLGDESPRHLHAEFALQRSIMFRLDGDFKNSERVIHDFCCRCGTPEQSCLSSSFQQRQKRLNALYGLIHRSHLENLVQCEQYQLATEHISHWQLTETASPMEWGILPSRTLTTSKIFRSQAAFKCAQESLELCVKFLHPREPARAQVLCQLADVYNDVGFSSAANELLAPEIEEGRKEATKTKAFRRFLVSSVETCVQTRQYDDASLDLEQLGVIFSNLSRLDVSDQLLHIRTLVASARICHMRGEFRSAIHVWDVALRRVQSYNSFEGEGFTYSAIHLSRSLAYLELGEHERAESSFKHGKAILDRGPRDYWIPTFAKWVEEVLQKLESMAGWAKSQ
ncbi:hypothetical protein EJ05DRAFT_295619 [Pseudovirgaria hyperparasitica]|uniref:TPR-like protein n=1 Tax=Pseudovirgaria hyperparasitica TaxID=470096 RepID=A0A6A6VS34_9PEZI|nr:uncharacterized protein EJ05DRAFT_295619 [Pseudovirgaria hyperparasitica]KAF2752574.1 hypothetical protein EJ05DRAFT_295619 [Pseudovirgaria hyperparasitica]